MPELTDIQRGLPSAPAYVGSAPALGSSPVQEVLDAPYTVVLGPLLSPSSPFRLQVYPYLEFGVRTVILRDPGYAQRAVEGAPGALAEVVRIHAGRAMKVVLFSALRVGAKPAIPSKNTGSTNEVPGPDAIAFDVPGHLPDGTAIWSVCGVYTYFLQTMPTENDYLTVGAAPFTTETPSGNTYGPGDYVTDMIGPSPPPAAGGPPGVTF